MALLLRLGAAGRKLSWPTALLLLTSGCATTSREASIAPGYPVGPAAPPTSPAEADAGYGYGFEAERAEGAPGRLSPSGMGKSNPQSQAPLGSPDPAPPETPGQPDAVTNPAKAPLLIYAATLTLGVNDVRKNLVEIEKLAREQGGYLVTRSDNDITIRIPAQGFNAVLDKLAALGDELHREVRVEDVTAQFRDLELRLANAKAVRERLEQLLAKAVNVGEAIQVEHELTRVSEEIESMQGKLKLFRELIAFSTITVRFQGTPIDQVQNRINLPFPWLNELGLPNLLSF